MEKVIGYLPRKHRETGRQLIRFAVSTLISASFTLGLPLLLHEIGGIEQKLAVAISQASALVLNFVMIRLFVFRSNNGARRDLAYYVGSAAAFRGLEYLLFLALLELAGLHYFPALLITLGVSTVVKFGWYRFLFHGRTEPVV
jgi:putative flippase GtrA